MVDLPPSTGCYVCGTENQFGLRQRFHADEGGVFTHFRTAARHCGYTGVCHGGIIAALLDETMGWATAVAKHRFFITAQIAVRYRAPLPEGEEVRVNGRYLRDKVGLWLAEGEIVGEDGKLYATATGTYAPAPDEANRRFIEQIQAQATGLDPFGGPPRSSR
jgi:uncharacterized protein (TIGR00369 family)